MKPTSQPRRILAPSSTLDAWVVGRQPKPQARLRLYCLPYAGGSASVFRAWPDGFPADIDVWPIQYPGRESRLREAPIRDLCALVQALGQALLPTLDLPYALFGHSMGSLIAFELARWLAERLAGPVHLFVSGMRAPQRLGAGLPIHTLPDALLVEALRRLNGTPEEVLQNAELMELFLPTLRADFETVETYQFTPGEPLDCPISAFGGQADHRVSEPDLTAWEQHTRARFRWRLVPGDHFFVRNAPPALLQAIAADLDANT